MTTVLCECGCGAPTHLAPKTKRAIGWIKGQPIRFIHGHARRTPWRYLVDVDTGCWIWQGHVINSGYGTHGKQLAHRLAYERSYGPIPDGMTVDHVKARGCTSKACVNPAHLEAVTIRENSRRSSKTTLTPETVIEIRERVAASESRAAVARDFGISASYVTKIASGQRWGDVGGPRTAPVTNHPGARSLRGSDG